MDLKLIIQKVRNGQYVISQHADRERQNDNLTIVQLKDAIFSGRILEQYADTGRGKSCLVAGIAANVPIHIVCGMRGDKIVFVTVYIPRPPKFIDPFTRALKAGVK